MVVNVWGGECLGGERLTIASERKRAFPYEVFPYSLYTDQQTHQGLVQEMLNYASQ